MFDNCKKLCGYCEPGHPGKIIKNHPHYKVSHWKLDFSQWATMSGQQSQRKRVQFVRSFHSWKNVWLYSPLANKHRTKGSTFIYRLVMANRAYWTIYVSRFLIFLTFIINEATDVTISLLWIIRMVKLPVNLQSNQPPLHQPDQLHHQHLILQSVAMIEGIVIVNEMPKTGTARWRRSMKDHFITTVYFLLTYVSFRFGVGFPYHPQFILIYDGVCFLTTL